MANARVAHAGSGSEAGKGGHAHALATVGGQACASYATGDITSGGNGSHFRDTNNQPTGIAGPNSVAETDAPDAEGKSTTVHDHYGDQPGGIRRVQSIAAARRVAEKDRYGADRGV